MPLAPIHEVRLPADIPVTPRSRRFAHAPLVLCIDDERQVREGMAALLGSWGCETVLGESAEEVLASPAVAGRTPDLLLIDLHLGDGENGFSVIARLRQHWGADLPAALITANRDPAAVSVARSQRVDILLEAGEARATARPDRPTRGERGVESGKTPPLLPHSVIPRLGLGIHEFACNRSDSPNETRGWQGQALP